jgi:hypothetical protein
VETTRSDRLPTEQFRPATRQELADFEARLLAAVAHVLQEPPNRAALAARSSDMLGLIDDVAADWTGVVHANGGNESEETRSELRSVAQFSLETLAELVQGMTWREVAGSITALVKLSRQGAGWNYSFTYTDPRSGAMETVAGGTLFPGKREAGLRAASAVWETAAKLHGVRAAGG